MPSTFWQLGLIALPCTSGCLYSPGSSSAACRERKSDVVHGWTGGRDKHADMMSWQVKLRKPIEAPRGSSEWSNQQKLSSPESLQHNTGNMNVFDTQTPQVEAAVIAPNSKQFPKRVRDTMRRTATLFMISRFVKFLKLWVSLLTHKKPGC